MFANLNVFYNAKTRCISREPYPNDNKHFYGIGHMLFTAMQKYQENIAQIDAITSESVTYKMLLLKCIRCALKMRDLGVEKGDLISMSSDNHLNMIVPMIATQFLGAIFAPIDRILSYEDNKRIMRLIRPKLIFIIGTVEESVVKIVDELQLATKIITFTKSDNHNVIAFQEFLHEHPQETNFQPYICKNLNEHAFVIFSSGTTGNPKGIYHTHNQYQYKIGLEEYSDIKVGLYYCEIFWSATLVREMIFFTNGITNVVVDFMERSKIWKFIEKFKINYVFYLASTISKIHEITRDVTSLKLFEITGDCVQAKDMENLASLLPHVKIINTYGLTQIGMISTFHRNESNAGRLHSCGYLTPGTSIKILDQDNGKALTFNKQGAVYVKIIPNFGYFKDLYDIRQEYDNEGFYRTGDIGYYDEDCCLYIVGRECDSIKTLIWKVSPSMLENVITSHPDVIEAAVIGLPDHECDNQVTGIVVLNPSSSLTEEELLEFVHSKVDYHHHLKGGIKFVKEMPKTSMGKLKRKQLLDMVLNNKI